MKQIPFDSKYVEDIKSGDKYRTVRYDWGRDIERGDIVELVDGDREVFETATIKSVIKTNIVSFANVSPPGHKQYNSPKEMVEYMEEYYSNIDVDSEVTAIRFDINE